MSNNNYTLSDFDFDLPKELIAQFPLEQRSASRLLCLNRQTGTVSHHTIKELPDLLKAHDLLVFNNTKVIKARLSAHKITGGKLEIMVERVIDNTTFLAQLKANRPLKAETEITIDAENLNSIKAKITGRKDDMFIVEMTPNQLDAYAILEQYGTIPLPHYIERNAENLDLSRYQTVFAEKKGAVAAPTAGLHFDEALLNNLEQEDIGRTFLTLHVGAGTFKPVRHEDITKHKMHSEYYELDQPTCDKIVTTKQNGGRVIAVGTTVTRSLESVAKNGGVQASCGETDIFIRPGFEYKCIDGLITNFHLPKSTLIMLVAAFAGYENVMNAYKEAVKQKYRFFSYGDAMLII